MEMEVDIKPVIGRRGSILEIVEKDDTFPTTTDTEISGEEWHIGSVKTEGEVASVPASDEYEPSCSSDTEDETYVPTSIKSKSTSTKRKLRKCGTVKDTVKRTGSYPCAQCDKSFRFNKNLQDHISRVHHSNKVQFKCPRCPKYFSYHDSVRVHLRSHTNERPSVCNVCKVSFTKNSYLVRHKTIHLLEVKPYLCLLCKLRFGRRDTARSHAKHFHQLQTEKDFVSSILYQRPKSEDFDGDEDNNFRSKKKVNIIGEPCKVRGRPRVRNSHTGIPVSVLPKRCFVSMGMSSASDSSTTQNKSLPKSQQSNVKIVVNQKTETNATLQKTSEGPTLKCMFCADVFYSAADLAKGIAVTNHRVKIFHKQSIHHSGAGALFYNYGKVAQLKTI